MARAAGTSWDSWESLEAAVTPAEDDLAVYPCGPPSGCGKLVAGQCWNQGKSTSPHVTQQFGHQKGLSLS